MVITRVFPLAPVLKHNMFIKALRVNQLLFKCVKGINLLYIVFSVLAMKKM